MALGCANLVRFCCQQLHYRTAAVSFKLSTIANFHSNKSSPMPDSYHSKLQPQLKLNSLLQFRRCSTETSESDDDAKKSNKEKYEPVDVETSIKYLDSEAYNITYGDRPVWYHYRPNHPKSRPRRKTRRTCVRGGYISTGNPCPICRDNHLVLDYRNIKLLKQFLTPNEMYIYKPSRTQICMKQYEKFLVCLEKAKDVGLLEDKWLQFRAYDYTQYYDSLKVKPVADEPRRTNSFIHKLYKESQV